MKNQFNGSLFPCPVCEANCYPEKDTDFLTELKCSKCNEKWAVLYIRGFWAGYAKKEKEIV